MSAVPESPREVRAESLTGPGATGSTGPGAPLSVQLREATRPQHERAENRGFVVELMGGELGVDAYVDLAVQHHAIYQALEATGERLRLDPVAASLVLPELLRLPSLEADLVTLRGADWRRGASLVPATATYVARLEELTTPGEYLAHAYTRYLGDLSGGQIVARMLQRHYGMTSEQLTFYTFTQVPKPKPFKDRYRELMDAAPFTAAEVEAVVAEARVAFDLNAALFDDLGVRHTAAPAA